MIEKTELRIGNIVLFDTKQDIIHSLMNSSVTGDLHSHWHYERLQPIPLTPEILGKCGLINVRDFTYVLKHSDTIHIVLIQGLKYFMVSITGPFGMVQLPAKHYLHEIQNMVHALTGTELTINL